MHYLYRCSRTRGRASSRDDTPTPDSVRKFPIFSSLRRPVGCKFFIPKVVTRRILIAKGLRAFPAHGERLAAYGARFLVDPLLTIVRQRSVMICKLQAEIRSLADSFLFTAVILEPSRELEEELRDKADQPVLGTLLAAQYDCLITGDKDLLALAG